MDPATVPRRRRGRGDRPPLPAPCPVPSRFLESALKILISHSWRDKTVADQLAGDLSAMAEVWQDITRLRPGDPIQPTIDAALAEMDLVVLIWSEHAAGSDGVAAEVETTLRRGKPIVPCLLDDTPLRDDLADTLGVDFHDYTLGFGRLCIVILRHVSADLGMDVADELGTVKDVEGVLDYVQNYRNKQGLSGPDRDYWIGRVTEAMGAMFQRVTALQERMQDAGDSIQQIYAKLEAAGSDRTRVQAVLHEVIRSEHEAPELMRQVRSHIEGYLRTLPETSVPADVAELGPRATRFAGSHDPGDGGARKEIEEGLRRRVPPQMLAPATDLVHDYITSMRPALQALANLAAASQSAAAGQVVQQLFDYLESPDDLLPEAQHGAWGYLDDAWLVHNTAYRLVEAGLASPQAFPVAWDRLVAADQIVTAVLPPSIRYQLADGLTQMLGTIAAEVQAYAPQFAKGGRGYQPLMGQAPAVGGLGPEMDQMYQSLQHSLGQTSLDGWQASLDEDYAASQGPGYSYGGTEEY